jgi:glutathione synthase/RimK-type ligase-like ATP-grasp enzyme
MVVHAGNRQEVGPALGYPCVLKRPDSSFSQGVVKAENPEELDVFLTRFLQKSALVVAQAFAHSDYDWRVGILGGQPLYACRYYMARGHWQIQKTTDEGQRTFGKHETLPIEAVPQKIIDLAVQTSRLIGNGLYGIDIKESGEKLLIMEVNDNPNIDAGVEDAFLKNELYLRVMRHFYEQLEKKGRGAL